MFKALGSWSPSHGLRRLRGGIRRAGQAIGRLFRRGRDSSSAARV